jgi:transcriptional regulator with XRE-family HTH domain
MLKLVLQFSYKQMQSKENVILNQFGDKVRELRKIKGLSQEQLAFKSGLHRTYIGMIERAERNISIINVQKIADALEVTTKELFFYDT